MNPALPKGGSPIFGKVLSTAVEIVLHRRVRIAPGGRTLDAGAFLRLDRPDRCWSGVRPALTGVRREGGSEFRVMTHPIAVPADVDDVAVMHEPIEERRRHDFIAEEDVTPFGEALIEVSTVLARSYRFAMSWKKSIAPVRGLGDSRSRQPRGAKGRRKPRKLIREQRRAKMS